MLWFFTSLVAVYPFLHVRIHQLLFYILFSTQYQRATNLLCDSELHMRIWINTSPRQPELGWGRWGDGFIWHFQSMYYIRPHNALDCIAELNDFHALLIWFLSLATVMQVPIEIYEGLHFGHHDNMSPKKSHKIQGKNTAKISSTDFNVCISHSTRSIIRPWEKETGLTNTSFMKIWFFFQ